MCIPESASQNVVFHQGFSMLFRMVGKCKSVEISKKELSFSRQPEELFGQEYLFPQTHTIAKRTVSVPHFPALHTLPARWTTGNATGHAAYPATTASPPVMARECLHLVTFVMFVLAGQE